MFIQTRQRDGNLDTAPISNFSISDQPDEASRTNESQKQTYRKPNRNASVFSSFLIFSLEAGIGREGEQNSLKESLFE